MKKIIQLHILLIAILLFAGCKKNTTPATPANDAACKPTSMVTTVLMGTPETYNYTYDAEGKLSGIKKFPTAFPYAIKDSTVVSDLGKTSYTHYSAYPVETYTHWGSYYNQLPPDATISFTEQGVTTRDAYNFKFTYDAKNRLTRIIETTPNITGDYEYDLGFSYDNNDNVSVISQIYWTGPIAPPYLIYPTGYDDKPTPYAGVKNWYLIMLRGLIPYDMNDPQTILTGLSKNNPLGYTSSSNNNKTIAYTYNDKGFPLKRKNTQINPNGSTYYFEETYTYQCN